MPHVLPFQRSINVCGPLLLLDCIPTAQSSWVCGIRVTLLSSPLDEMVGLGTMPHVLPFQCSIRG